ncbi:hypothetical protein ACFV7R_05660 [Streptomyces sp. NPDC059866]|uniref:hypothetical protein n=1 Tax=Streptomyces sp. NPDC059866 TaxID=3346978 RepID=UPI003653426C
MEPVTAVHECRVGDEAFGEELREGDRRWSEHERGDRVQPRRAQQIPAGIGPCAFLKRVDDDVPGMRRVDSDQRLTDRERGTGVRETDLDNRLGALGDQQVA